MSGLAVRAAALAAARLGLDNLEAAGPLSSLFWRIKLTECGFRKHLPKTREKRYAGALKSSISKGIANYAGRTCSPGPLPAFKRSRSFGGVRTSRTFSARAMSSPMCWCRTSRPALKITNGASG